MEFEFEFEIAVRRLSHSTDAQESESYIDF